MPTPGVPCSTEEAWKLSPSSLLHPPTVESSLALLLLSSPAYSGNGGTTEA